MSGSNYLKRRELTAALLARREGALVVPGLGSPPAAAARDQNERVGAVVQGEVLAVRNGAGKITQVRLRRADGRYLRVELDGNGALLGIMLSGSFAEVTGHVYLKDTGGEMVRWIRVQRFRTVPRPKGWVEPQLTCVEEEGAPDGPDDEHDPDGGQAPVAGADDRE